jgi:type VI secretion system secreted protein Hcp
MKGKLVVGVAVAALAVAAVATYSWAAAGADSQTLNACVDNQGNLRLVAIPGACRKNEHAISWNTTGPQGPAGAAGAQGQQGPPGASASNPDVATGTVLITAQKQGALPQFDLQGFSHEIVSPRDPASGLPTGKRQHQPIVITKQLDASTPRLLSALVTNEDLSSVVITLDEGGNAVATVTLTNASISDYQAHGTAEQWSFTYQKITWTWTDGGITASDDWEAPTS